MLALAASDGFSPVLLNVSDVTSYSSSNSNCTINMCSLSATMETRLSELVVGLWVKSGRAQYFQIWKGIHHGPCVVGFRLLNTLVKVQEKQ